MTYKILHIGVGNVGRELVNQIQQYGHDFVYSGLFDKSGGVFAAEGLSAEQVSVFPTGADPQVTASQTVSQIPTPFVLVDTTAVDATLPVMKDALRKGGAVAMSNKKPLTGTQADWDELHTLGGARLFYETTVGAGLPVVSTLKSLLATGDEIVKIQGCFSGTLGYIFSELESGAQFSAAVTQAKAFGFTEPDPRDDLSGMDVARKVLILSRIICKKLEISEVDVENLYSEALGTLSPEDFMSQVSTLDETYSAKAAAAKANGTVLRYVATVTPTEHSVKLLAVPAQSDIGGLRGPDNIVVIQTKRYYDNPLIIKGPGAGVPVTAAGVFADCLAAAQILKGENQHANV